MNNPKLPVLSWCAWWAHLLGDHSLLVGRTSSRVYAGTSGKCRDSRSHTFPVHAWSPPGTEETLNCWKYWEAWRSKKQRASLPRPIGPKSLSQTQVFSHSLLFLEKQGKADGAITVTKVSVASEWLRLEAMDCEEQQALFHCDVSRLVDMKSSIGIQM